MSSLMLHPMDADWLPASREDFLDDLRQAGLIGLSLPDAFAPGYLVGERFLSLVTFLGCSPDILLEPDSAAPGREFCAVRIHHYPEGARFVLAERAAPPRCPVCRSSMTVDRATVQAETLMSCPDCGQQSPLLSLNWRRSAGYASCFVEITGVYPQEARPTEALLELLKRVSQGDWRYFYSGSFVD